MKRVHDAVSRSPSPSDSGSGSDSDDAVTAPEFVPALDFDVTRTHVARIGAWYDRVREWKSLAAPLAKPADTAHWLDDYSSGAWRPGHHPEFLAVVRGVLPAHLPLDVSKVDLLIASAPSRRGKCFVRQIRGDDKTAEYFLETCLFRDWDQRVFIKLARAFVASGVHVDFLIAVCCWAIEARQLPPFQQSALTREALANVVALVLTLRGGPPFTYSDTAFEFVFEPTDAAPGCTILLTEFARQWFHLELPNFVKAPERWPAFLCLVRAHTAAAALVHE